MPKNKALHKLRSSITFIALLLGLFAPNFAEEAAHKSNQYPSLDELKRLREQDYSNPSSRMYAITPLTAFCADLEPSTKTACIDAYTEYFRYESYVFRQRQATFGFQQMSTQIILATVVLLVLVGVTFAALQFWLAFKTPEVVAKPSSAGEPPAAQQSNFDLRTDLELSSTGFKIKSSVLGLVLLLVSMGFFYLYIRYVYPIEEEPQGQQYMAPPSPVKK